MQTLQQGHTLQGGKYTIEHRLGVGAFGVTYLAQMQVKTGGALGEMEAKLNVAIKEFFMHDLNTRKEGSSVVEGSSNKLVSNYRRKFRTEAVNLSHLKHPSIVKVLDVFDENGTTYYVMDYIEGQSLDDYVVQKKGLPVIEALNIARQIVDAVGYMHAHKMLHLDIKPKNVMMDLKGKAYLIDFGLSKQYTDDGMPESSTTLGLGTPGYAPMEQSSYKPDGSFPATLDIYALGATLYKMLTGKTPPDSPTVFNEGLDLEPMITHSVPSWLQNAVVKTMSPGKRQRPQTAIEFKTMLVTGQNGTALSAKKATYDDEATQYISSPTNHSNSNTIALATQTPSLPKEEKWDALAEDIDEIKDKWSEYKGEFKEWYSEFSLPCNFFLIKAVALIVTVVFYMYILPIEPFSIMDKIILTLGFLVAVYYCFVEYLEAEIFEKWHDHELKEMDLGEWASQFLLTLLIPVIIMLFGALPLYGISYLLSEVITPIIVSGMNQYQWVMDTISWFSTNLYPMFCTWSPLYQEGLVISITSVICDSLLLCYMIRIRNDY